MTAFSRNKQFWLLVPIWIIIMFGCKKVDLGYSSFSELGADTSEYTIPSEEGSIRINVLSNEEFDILIPQEMDWLSSSDKKMKNDTSFVVSYEKNEAFKRKGIIVLYAEKNARYDTITIRQYGEKSPELIFSEMNTTVLGDGGEVESELKSNVPIESLNIEIVYPESQEDEQDKWIYDEFFYDESTQIFRFKVDANPHMELLRNAQIKLSFIDGWGDQVSSSLYLLQANAQNLFGVEASYPDIRLWAGEDVTSDIFIEGYIISDNESLNVGDNPQNTPTQIDYNENFRTVYIQSIDGKYGFKLKTATVDDNVFKRYSKVQILLKGTNVQKENNPNRFTINGISSSMVMSQTQGNAESLIRKEKFINELDDDDIYTFVTLKNAEFPIRKGSFTPVNEGYTRVFNAGRISKYPLLMRDVRGENMFLYTNVGINEARNGEILPQGSGEISGVIVHEKFPRFEYDDSNSNPDAGTIGRYQMRWVDLKDIKIRKNINDGFSKLLVEFQYPDIISGKANATTGDGVLYPSNNLNAYASTSYYYLGPVGANYLGNNNQYGTGALINGQKQNTATGTNSDGKGGTSTDAIAVSRNWWNYEKNRGEAWLVEFSTEGISSDVISLQFSAINWSSTNGPRFWSVEWSEHGDMDKTWNKVSDYSVPDISNWSNTLYHQLPGYKNIDVKLPSTILNKPKVYVRLIVNKNLGSSGYTYATEPLAGDVNSSIGYLSIRYNK